MNYNKRGATPITPIRLPLHLKRAINQRTNNLSAFVIDAIKSKLEHKLGKIQQKEMGDATQSERKSELNN